MAIGQQLRKWSVIGALAGAAAGFCAIDAQAQTLPEAMQELLQNHRRMKAAESDLAAASEKAKEALGDWFPKLDLTASYGAQRLVKGDDTADTDMEPRETEAKITQLLWDFGSTHAAIDAARLSFTQAQAGRDAAEQTLMLEGVTAYLDLIRRKRLLDFAKGSEDNVKRQTDLEDARVRRGSGFSTDVLQAKQQLAGATALRVRAEGAFQNAINRFTAVFYKAPRDAEAMAEPRVPLDKLPTSLDDLIENAIKDNPNLRAAQTATEISRANYAKTKADKLAPTLNLIGSVGHKHDFDGTRGSKLDELVKVEMKYNFNLGFTAINTLKVSGHALDAVENRYADAKETVSEQAKNAWQDLITARLNAEHLRNQADIAAEFPENARKERQLGRRTLIGVLSGETALINASSDATSAETDVALAVFKMLTIMGKLSLNDIK